MGLEWYETPLKEATYEVNEEIYELNVKYMMKISCFDTVRLLPFIVIAR